MREVRAGLRKHIKKEGMKVKMNGEDVNNSYRRVVADDYRPLIKQAPVVAAKPTPAPLTPPREPSPPLMTTTEIYDTQTATTVEEKQRWLEMWRSQVEREEKEKEETRRKLEKRQSMKIFGSTVNIGSIANLNFSKLFGEKKSSANASESTNGAMVSPMPQRHAMDASAQMAHHHEAPSAGSWPAPRPVGDDELVMKF
ncbi:hypothetical protein PFISCL1PPCAC_4634 [Pristionchus fissidentatus]|uniref:Uncharacterized protein n=1 Tax=Pristionchus fissidentatus TaxID=1538716 RepID=A0AAV5V3G0_9BILA|nr:hypothetical protein PFISCL1PPCAC_4634 [Pristionchus fissidentatus]